MEALLRWPHAKRGLVPPAEFISVAEDSGLIIPLGEWVLRKALADAARWPDHVRIAVNLSPVQFRSRHLAQVVVAACAAARVAPSRLELEVTEAAFLEEVIARHPRGDLADEFARLLRRETAERPRSRAAFLWRIALRHAVFRHPLDR